MTNLWNSNSATVAPSRVFDRTTIQYNHQDSLLEPRHQQLVQSLAVITSPDLTSPVAATITNEACVTFTGVDDDLQPTLNCQTPHSNEDPTDQFAVTLNSKSPRNVMCVFSSVQEEQG